MRLRPIEPISFTHLAIINVAVFVFEVISVFFFCFIYKIILATNGYVTVTEVVPPYPLSSPWPLADRYPRADLENYQTFLSAEIARYPRAVIQRIGLKRIVLCFEPTQGTIVPDGRAVVPEGTIYLNVRLTKPGQELSLRRAIHHETFHFIDAILDRTPGAGADWARLNPPDFEYSGYGIIEDLEITNQSPDQRADIPGLLNYYSMASAQEDRAVLFSYMMVSPDYLRTAAGEDVIIRAKLSFLKRQLLALSREFDAILRAAPPTPSQSTPAH